MGRSFVVIRGVSWYVSLSFVSRFFRWGCVYRYHGFAHAFGSSVVHGIGWSVGFRLIRSLPFGVVVFLAVFGIVVFLFRK